VPYYVYAVRPFAQLERLGEHAAFRDASAMAKALRAERAERAGNAADGGAGEHIRVMFAETALAAEDLLLQSREPPPPGDE
jgi:hypothetical protein